MVASRFVPRLSNCTEARNSSTRRFFISILRVLFKLGFDAGMSRFCAPTRLDVSSKRQANGARGVD
jgi:hypothetical protein